MGWYPQTPEKLSFYKKIPKVELHRHLEGSLRLETLIDIARQHGLTLPRASRFRSLVQMQEGDPLTFTNFLSKFQMLRQFYRSPEVISRITREAINDAAADGVQYMELRFTPVALSRMQGFSLSEVIDWVVDSTSQANKEYGIETRLILSINRHESLELAEDVLKLAVDRIERGVIGLDLAGNEADFPALPFKGIFQEARQAGLHITLHAGEWGPGSNVRDAIREFDAERIGHGVRVLEDPEATALARERGTAFEVCITSNYQTGVVPALSAHPLPRMLNAGLNVTFNTDDPSISQITLSDEYRLVLEDLGLTLPLLCESILASAKASFLPPAERDALVERLRHSLDDILIA